MSCSLLQSLTLTYLEQEQFTIDWVYNILEHRKEAETIIFEDPDPEMGFVLLPDYKVRKINCSMTFAN